MKIQRLDVSDDPELDRKKSDSESGFVVILFVRLPANLINSAKVWSMNQNNPTFNLILGLPSLDTRMKYFASVQNLEKTF